MARLLEVWMCKCAGETRKEIREEESDGNTGRKTPQTQKEGRHPRTPGEDREAYRKTILRTKPIRNTTLPAEKKNERLRIDAVASAATSNKKGGAARHMEEFRRGNTKTISTERTE